MPRLSLWKDGAHTNDFKFFDRNIKEQFTVGGTGVHVHKYLGILDQGPSKDKSQPQSTTDDPLAIQDFLFLENRDRKYETDIYNLRGIYNVADTDFDLSQFGLFLQNDTLFVTFHLSDMDRILGRRLMSGDVLEMPHLKDYNSLDTSLEVALKRYYVVQEGSRPAEGYSPTWWPHLWRVKCTPLVDSQEYNDILNKIQLNDNTGESTDKTLRDLLSTYTKELEITTKVVEQAEVEVPNSGYDTSKFYVVPADPVTGAPEEPKGFTADSGAANIGVTTDNSLLTSDNGPITAADSNISTADSLVTADTEISSVALVTADASNINAPDTGISIDNTLITADSARTTPENSKAYSGYLVGDGLAPNGEEITMGTSFPSDPTEGNYVLRLDFLPNRLFRYNGNRWNKVEDNLRSNPTPGKSSTLTSGFINNTATTTQDDNTVINQRQALSKALEIQEDI